MKDTLMTLEPIEEVQEPTNFDIDVSADQALFEEAKALRRRRWRYGGAAFAGALVLGVGLGMVVGRGAPTRSGSGATAPTQARKVPGSALVSSASDRNAAPMVKFSTDQAGLDGKVSASDTSFRGTWVVPGVPISAFGDSRIQPTEAAWIGMGAGSTKPTSVFRVGVDAFTQASATSVHYQAFWGQGTAFQIHRLAQLVAPGDKLRASIYERAPGAEWVITLADVTEGWQFRQTVGYRGPEHFPFWFEEAPAVISKSEGSRVAKFVPVSPVIFKRLRVNGHAPQPGRATYIEMVNTTTGEASVPRYTERKDSLTITQMSADAVLRHNPL